MANLESLLYTTLTLAVVTFLLAGADHLVVSLRQWWKPTSTNGPDPIWKYLWGRLTDPLGYVDSICFQTRGPIISFQSIPLVGTKLLLVNDPEMASLIYRKSRVLSLYPLVKNLVRSLSISLREYESLNPDHDPTYPAIKQLEHITHTAMAPGRIHGMHKRGCDVVSACLGEARGEACELRTWLATIFTRSSAASLYGHENPIRANESLIAALEDYKNDEPILYLRILKPLTAPRGYSALKKFQDAFTAYYNAGFVTQSSPVIQERYAAYRKHWENPTVAAVEIMILQAAVMNFTSSVFWMLGFIFSSPELLRDLRLELEIACSAARRDGITPQGLHIEGSDEARQRRVHIDTNALIASSPLLVAVWMETLRVTSCAVSSRRALEDTVLDGHAIRKGAIVNVIVAPMLRDPAIWGANVGDFVPGRFLEQRPGPARSLLLPAEMRKKAFLPFGGGASWCPGRHFVTHQVMFAVAALVLGYDISGPDGETLEPPEIGRIKFFEGVRHPAGDLDVDMRRRRGFEDVTFEAVVDFTLPMATLPF